MQNANYLDTYPVDPVVISFFCYDDDDGKQDTIELAKTFLNYQRFMQCPPFWSFVSSMQVWTAAEIE